MKIYKASSKAGQNIIKKAQNFEGETLEDIYKTFSKAKARAYDNAWCYCQELGGNTFGICSHNTFGFTVAFCVGMDVYYITKDNAYRVIWDL